VLPTPSTLVLAVFSTFLRRLPPKSTLFPYTTLFRSSGDHPRSILKLNGCHSQDTQPCADYRAIALIDGGIAAEHGQHATLDFERSEEHTSELQLRENLVCRLLLEKKKRGRKTGA